MKNTLTQVSFNFRALLIRLLSPSIWQKAYYGYFVDSFPKPATIFMAKHACGQRVKCLEIGVERGLNAESILKTLNVESLYLIDPYPESHIDRGRRYDMTDAKAEMLRRLEPYQARVFFINKYSNEAADDVPSDLDFIYIDGDHSAKQVCKDLVNYWPKVRKGGVLAGHDFTGNYVSVVLEVVGFAQRHGLELQAEKADWWMVKP